MVAADQSILLWPNLVDDQVTVPSFSGGRWLADQPIQWVRDDGIETGFLAYAARSDTAEPTDTTFTIDHRQQVALKGAAIPSGNFSVEATITLERSDAADFSTLVASITKPVYPVIYPLGTAPSYSPYFISGKPVQRLAKMPWIAIFDTINVARYSRFSISDAGNPDGYVQFPRLFMAAGYQPLHNFAPGATLKPLTRTVAQESIAGARFFDVRTERRQWSVTYEGLPESELWAQVWEMQTQLGVSRQAFFVANPADTPNLHRHSFMCTLEDPSGVVLDNVARGDATLLLSEVIA